MRRSKLLARFDWRHCAARPSDRSIADHRHDRFSSQLTAHTQSQDGIGLVAAVGNVRFLSLWGGHSLQTPNRRLGVKEPEHSTALH